MPDAALAYCLARSQRGLTLNSWLRGDAEHSPKRSAPANAIIAPLSVQYSMAG